MLSLRGGPASRGLAGSSERLEASLPGPRPQLMPNALHCSRPSGALAPAPSRRTHHQPSLCRSNPSQGRVSVSVPASSSGASPHGGTSLQGGAQRVVTLAPPGVGLGPTHTCVGELELKSTDTTRTAQLRGTTAGVLQAAFPHVVNREKRYTISVEVQALKPGWTEPRPFTLSFVWVSGNTCCLSSLSQSGLLKDLGLQAGDRLAIWAGCGDVSTSGLKAAADVELEDFLQLLPPESRSAVRRCAAARLAESNADGSRRSAPPPLLVDLAADAGRDVRLAFSDGSKRTLEGVKVPMGRALEQLAAHVHALGDASAAGGAMVAGSQSGGGSARRGGRRRSQDSGTGTEAASGGEGDSWESADDGPEGPAPPSLPLFGLDNRCCPPGTLHRVSALRDPRSGRVIGLTYRVGRHLPGVAGPLADVLADLAGRGRAWYKAKTKSLLLLGRPGSGKTTLLRDIAAHLSDGLGLGVVVVDTSNEIAGGDALPHACIGSARRLMVGPRHRLAEAMIEAVQNHGPQVIVVDEIANAAEVAAAHTISTRGVMLVATAHGTSLRSLMANNQLNSLIGGLQSVVLGDAKAGETNNGSKTRTERRGQPVFRTMVEVLGDGRLLLRPDVASSVDEILGLSPKSQQWQQPSGGGDDLRTPGDLVHLLYPEAEVDDDGDKAHDKELLCMAEQLRWTEPGEDGSEGGEEHAQGSGSGAGREQLRVRLLELGAEAPEEEEED
ncbi:hypothetical protein HYH03_001701 [Edaphochlamys debaryana]|uniref:AAA+ ATPase domain-containing protein n=1 Tax=Edaphochlamys debaryana TaxID=47281 RepID=A0A835YLY4_9CHLO|nr:hypothetical protein HYH03_001701 [Edaphochlamys debaryana]|eukprot:KAG2500119.1 hypothetical protein HYH03_001701 [Edaphochlamys debaryana]